MSNNGFSQMLRYSTRFEKCTDVRQGPDLDVHEGSQSDMLILNQLDSYIVKADTFASYYIFGMWWIRKGHILASKT